MTKEQLLQDWLPRLMGALQEVRNNENAAAQETIYELYVEMKQQTLAEKISTFSEITLEDQMSAMAIELLASQKRVAELENSICQRAFEAKQEQGEPVFCECANCANGMGLCHTVEAMQQEQGEPVAWMFQHEDTGLTDCVDAQQVEWGFEKNNPRWQKIGPLYTTPQQRKPLTDGCCTWKNYDDFNMPDTWEADCGAMWTFTEGGPKDNDMKFCPNCGKPIIEAAHGIQSGTDVKE